MVSEMALRDDRDSERLLAIGRRLVSERDLDALLGDVLEAARELTRAHFAALGVLDDSREELEKFLYVGIDDATRREIGPLPRGRGLLGELITHPRPLRLAEIGSHPRSFGFPPGHPPMKSFLGVPVVIRGETYGNLYLTDKSGGDEFGERDQEIVTVLADWAGIAIDNARLYTRLERRNKDLERAVEGLAANVELGDTVGREIHPDRINELIVKRGRALLDARRFVMLVLEGDRFRVADAAGEGAEQMVGQTIERGGSVPGEVLRAGRTERLPDLTARVRLGLGDLADGASTAIVAPVSFQGRAQGVFVALDRLDDEGGFEPEHELLLESFAASAGIAIARARAVEAEMLQLSIEASERERRRWARELHDETLQDLGALGLLLDTVDSPELPAKAREAIEIAGEQLARGIENLQGLITELRPAVLDEIGLGAALETLIGRVADTSGLRLTADFDLAHEAGREPTRLDGELEGAVYRLVQEALNNAAKHSGADAVTVSVTEAGGAVELRVSDNGSGFDPEAPHGGFGLVGMRERAALAHGSLGIESQPGAGTTVVASVPVLRVPISQARKQTA